MPGKLTAVWLALALLGAASAHAGVPQLNLAVPTVRCSTTLNAKADFYTEHLAGRLTSVGAKVTTPRQIAELLGLQRQRQLLGCDGDTCIAELVHALGVDAVVQVEIAQFEDFIQVNMRVMSSSGVAVLGETRRAKDSGDVLEQLTDLADVAAPRTASVLARDLVPPPRPRPAFLKPLGLVGFGLGAASAAGSVVGFVSAREAALRIPVEQSQTPVMLSDAQAWAASGRTSQTVGVALAVAAGVLFAVAALLLVLGSR